MIDSMLLALFSGIIIAEIITGRPQGPLSALTNYIIFLCVPIFSYWAVSYILMCKEIVTNIVELIGWRG